MSVLSRYVKKYLGWCVVGSVTLMLTLYAHLNSMYQLSGAGFTNVRPCGYLCQEDNSKPYLVATPGCMMPDFPVEEVMKYKTPPITGFLCSKIERLTEQEGQHLLLYKDRAPEYKLTAADLDCVYYPVDTSMARGSKLKASINLTEPRTLVVEDGVRVVCYNQSRTKERAVYVEAHHFIQPGKVREKKKKFKDKFGSRSDHPEKLSVLMMGTDGVSRYNFIRHMPLTHQYIMQELGALDFRGYNKIGENSEPNIYTILSGYFSTEFEDLECVRPKKRVDDCPIIWKDFAEAGYVTSFGEDLIGYWQIFNRFHKGFDKQPTDYMIERTFNQGKKSHGVPSYGGFTWGPCLDSKLKMRILHDYALSMANEMQDVPYFSFYWPSTLTHDKLRYATVADIELHRLMTSFQANGYLHHTVVLLISDHGLRYGPFRHTYLGMMEEKLPMMYAIFPPWFKTKYPKAWRNLVTNTRRLTSNRDIHQTCKALATAEFTGKSKSSPSFRGGQSLFQEVPETRNCSDVGIPERHCACQMYEAANMSDPSVYEAAMFATQHINLLLQNHPECINLTFDKVTDARLAQPSQSLTPKKVEHRVFTYMVQFQVLPSGAMLEALMKKQKGAYTVVGQIARTNKYGQQSHCIPDNQPVIRTYCLCKDLLIPSAIN